MHLLKVLVQRCSGHLAHSPSRHVSPGHWRESIKVEAPEHKASSSFSGPTALGEISLVTLKSQRGSRPAHHGSAGGRTPSPKKPLCSGAAGLADPNIRRTAGAESDVLEALHQTHGPPWAATVQRCGALASQPCGGTPRGDTPSRGTGGLSGPCQGAMTEGRQRKRATKTDDQNPARLSNVHGQ